MLETYTDLDEVLKDTWRMLFRPTQDKNSPLRTPSITTVSPEGLPASRTVVLRKVDKAQRLLRLYTDFRAQKVSDLQHQPELVWLFYDTRKQIQLRLRARAVIHHQNSLCREVWESIPVFARKNYCTASHPASRTLLPTNGLSEDWEEYSQTGFSHFALIDTTVYAIDWLFLHPKLQHRAQFLWHKGQWEGTWVIP